MIFYEEAVKPLRDCAKIDKCITGVLHIFVPSWEKHMDEIYLAIFEACLSKGGNYNNVRYHDLGDGTW